MPQARQTAKTTAPPAPGPEGLRLRFDRGDRRAAVSVDATRGLATWDEAKRTFEFVLATETPDAVDAVAGSTQRRTVMRGHGEVTDLNRRITYPAGADEAATAALRDTVIACLAALGLQVVR